MDISSENQFDLIESYVTGQMSPEDETEFEAYFLSKPDWQQKINDARELFDSIHKQEWENEINRTIVLLREGREQTSFFGRWKITLMPMLFAFGLGMLLVFKYDSNEMLITNFESINLDITRGSNIATDSIPIIKIGNDVDGLALNIDISHISSVSRKNLSVVVINATGEKSRHGLNPDPYGMLTFNVVGEFGDGDLLTIQVLSGPNGELLREFKRQIRRE